jgi:hypothetical protein
MKDKIANFLSSEKHYWWTVTLLPGAYSIIYLYLKNYTVVNSWQQFASFTVFFFAVPGLVFLIIDYFFKNNIPTKRNQLYWSFLLINFSIIFSLSIYLGWRWKGLIAFGLLVLAASFFVARHYKKIVLLLGIMCVIAFLQLSYYLTTTVMISNDWVQPMPFENAVFKSKPNVYLIQPDGYVGKNAASNELYRLDNNQFYNTLSGDGFIFNHNFRSNYPTTLASNSTLFTAQHHYLNYGNLGGELINARDIILGNNPVLNTFKNNGYQTHLILEHSYLMLNYPKVAYDTNNVAASELSILLPNYFLGKDYITDFKTQVNRASEKPQFYFLEILHPGHISFSKDREDAIAYETTKYKKEITSISQQLIDITQFIKEKDPTGIILIVADHGGFVGYTHTGAAFNKPNENVALKESVFNALYAVKAPEDFATYRKTVDSAIEVFPALFDYLAGEPAQEKDIYDSSSFLNINIDGNKKLFKYYNNKGIPVTEKVEKP